MKRQIEKNCIIVPLPSKGECYPHKKGEIPIAYMTAMDENILADKKLREENKAIDTLLEKKILDKDFKVDDLCVADRNAIILALRKNNYGNIYTDPISNEQIELSKIEYSDFDYFADDNGLFSYITEKGIIVKYRLGVYSDEATYYDIMEKNLNNNIGTAMLHITSTLLKKQTVEIEGNSSQEYIHNFIDKMTPDEQILYLLFINSNTPKVLSSIDFEKLFDDVITFKENIK